MATPIGRGAAAETGLAVAAAVAAAAFVGVPIWELIVPGPFDWHVQRPAFWQGGLEALVVAALVACGCAVGRGRAALALIALPGLFYLRRHAVDVPLLIDLAYFEVVIGLGMAVRRALRLPRDGGVDYLQAFVLGFLAWSLAAWSLSAVGLGSIKQLRWLTLLLAAVACSGRSAPFAVYAWRRARRLDRAERIWCGLLAVWILVLLARSNVVVGFDPLWYGLRGEYVLDPGRSLFEPLGLVSPVYYFPKLYEAFLLPVSRLGDFSVIDGVTILLLPPILLACRLLMRRLHVPPRAQWPTLALVATLPALANTAIGPKPDVVATLFVLLAALAAIETNGRTAIGAAAWMLACAGLACLAKLAAIPYVAALAIAAATSFARPRAAARETDALDVYPRRLGATALAATLALATFVTARTWLLSGWPTIGPDPLASAWKALGLTLKEPVGTLRWSYPVDWPGLPGVVLDVLFRPQHDLPHMIITWSGNVWLWLALIAAAAAALPNAAALPPAPKRALLPLVAVGVYLFVGIGYGERGSDGNYFLFALVPAILWSARAAFARLEGSPRAFAIVLACVPAFVAFHAGYSFASAGWSAGTHVFDARLGRGWHDARKRRRQALETYGLARIADALRERSADTHAVGVTLDSSGHWLPARFESIEQIGYARREYLASPRAFRAFLARFGIAYVIMPLVPEPNPTDALTASIRAAAAEAAAELGRLPGVRRIDDRRHYLLDLSALPADAIAGGTAPPDATLR